MDATANNLPNEFEVKGYPTLYFSSASGKLTQYDGVGAAEDVIDFIQANKDVSVKPDSGEDKQEPEPTKDVMEEFNGRGKEHCRLSSNWILHFLLCLCHEMSSPSFMLDVHSNDEVLAEDPITKGRSQWDSMKEAEEKFKGVNLYLKNLDDVIRDDQLKELFSEFGSITSCKVTRDPSGVSRGSGFVAFKTLEEASQALAEMNEKMVGNKPLYVALAQT